MSNFNITNKLGSIMTLAPLQDERGIALVLHPKGQKGDTMEISAETAAHEIIERVKKANWVTLTPVGVASAPAPSKPAAAPPPSPAPVAVKPEATQVMPPAEVEALVERTKASEPEPAPEPAVEPEPALEPTPEPEPMPEPPPVKRSRK